MTLHLRPDEEPDVDPDDQEESWEYISEAEQRHCGRMCERCGQIHPGIKPKDCPIVNIMTLKTD